MSSKTTAPPLPPIPKLALLLSHIPTNKKKDNDQICIIEIDASGKETIHKIPKLRRIRCMGCISGAVYLAGYETDIDVLDLKTGKFAATIGGGWGNAQVMTTMNNKVYAPCGRMFGGSGVGNLCEMDPKTKTFRHISKRKGWYNATAITSFDDKIFIVAGKMGGCTGGGGLWEIDMRTPPCTWASHTDKYLPGFAADGGKIYKTLQEAQKACLWDPTASGVTKDKKGTFTVRKGSSLTKSPSGEISWVKNVPYGYGKWTLKGKNGDWTNGTAMTHLGGRLFIVCGRRAGTTGGGDIWSVDPKTGSYKSLTSGGRFKMATTLSALGSHLFATCEDKLLKIDPSTGAVTQVGKRNWKDVQYVANLGKTSLLYFLDASKAMSGKGIPILGKQKLLASRGKQLFMQMFLGEKLPRDWAPMGPKEKLKLVPLKKDDDMYRRIVQRVQETMPSANIISITRVQNRSMWEDYARTMHKISMKNDGEIGERWLFHGTRGTKPDLLYQSTNAGGFDSRLGKGYYGTGSYFAEKAAYSHDYTHKTGGRRCKFFIARVLTGHSKSYGMTRADRLKRPPDLPSDHANAPGLYDSVNGGPHQGGSTCPEGSVMYVVYDRSQAYPQYLIEYDM